METIIILKYPATDITAIEQIIAGRDSFTVFLDGNTYSIVNYINELSGFRNFTAVLDRNVYTRIVALVNGKDKKQNEILHLQWASAILAFCQIAKITFDYNSSLYEYASMHGGENSMLQMKSFRIADNSNPKIFIDFALGRISEITAKMLNSNLDDAVKFSPEEFEKKIRYFRIHYTNVLKIAEIAMLDLSGVEKMLKYLEWMYSEFFFSQPALIFANRFFSPNPIKGMLKGISKRNLENAAWDLALVQDWRKRALAGQTRNEPVLLISGDRAVAELARQIAHASDKDAEQYFCEVWGKRTGNGKRIFDNYYQLWNLIETRKATDRTPPSYERQIEIMKDLETKILRGEPLKRDII